MPYSDDPPGPPWSHTTVGASTSPFSAGKYQKKVLIEGVTPPLRGEPTKGRKPLCWVGPDQAEPQSMDVDVEEEEEDEEDEDDAGREWGWRRDFRPCKPDA